MVPPGLQQLIILSLFVIPGFAFQAVRSKFRGPSPDDKDVGVRTLRSLDMSALLALIYVAIAGDYIIPRIRKPAELLNGARAATFLGLLLNIYSSGNTGTGCSHPPASHPIIAGTPTRHHGERYKGLA